MTKKIVIIILALASFISVDAQNEVIGGYVKKGGTDNGINATSRFPMYSVMKFPKSFIRQVQGAHYHQVSRQESAMWGLSYWIMVSSFLLLFSLPTPLRNQRSLMWRNNYLNYKQ